MKSTHYSGLMDKIARNAGYKNKMELFYDYDFIPTVLTPKHRKIEIVLLIYKYTKQNICKKRRF